MIDCIFLSRKGSCNKMNYGMKKPAFKFRCPKTINESAVCEKQCTKQAAKRQEGE